MSEGKIIKFDRKRRTKKEIRINFNQPRIILLTLILRNAFTGSYNGLISFVKFVLAGAIGVPLGGIWFFGKYMTFEQFVNYVQSQKEIVIMIAFLAVVMLFIFRTSYMFPWHARNQDGTVISLRTLWQNKITI